MTIGDKKYRFFLEKHLPQQTGGGEEDLVACGCEGTHTKNPMAESLLLNPVKAGLDVCVQVPVCVCVFV